MANSFQVQTKMNKAIAFQWKAYEGFADHCKNGNSELPNAVDRTGKTVYLRRPGKHVGSQVAMDGNYDLPDNFGPTSYGAMVDSVVPFTISKRFVSPLQVSVEDLLTKIEMSDAMDSHITPAITNLRNQINQYIAKYIETAAGNTLVTDGTADGYMKALYDASALMMQRGEVSDMDEKVVLFHPKVMPVLGLRGPGVFHSVGQEKMFAEGTYDRLAGYNVFQTPLLNTPTVVGLGASAVVASAYNVTALLTASWTPTWSVDITGATASVTIAAGTKIKFTNGSTDINWSIANTDGTGDAGYTATFTVVSTASADSSGNITLTLSEPFISGGDFKNVVSNLVAGTTKVSVATATGLIRPSYAFSKGAVVVGSPKVAIPASVDKGINLSLGGFNIALIEDHSLNMQRVTQLVAFIAVAVPCPERIVAIY